MSALALTAAMLISRSAALLFCPTALAKTFALLLSARATLLRLLRLPVLRKLAILGPRGLMPNPKAGTVTPDVGKAVTDAKAGKIEYRLDKQNIIHVPVGKASFGAEKLMANLDTVLEAIAKAKPAAAKGQYFKSATIATTMGPGVRVATNKYGV